MAAESKKKEKQVCLGIKEVMVLKEWFGFVVQYSQVEKRGSDLVEKLAAFEKEVLGEKK